MSCRQDGEGWGSLYYAVRGEILGLLSTYLADTVLSGGVETVSRQRDEGVLRIAHACLRRRCSPRASRVGRMALQQ